jgi:hypothetical protein
LEVTEQGAEEDIRDEVMGEWRKLRNEEVRDLSSSPSIVRIMKARRMRWVGHFLFLDPPPPSSVEVRQLGIY